MTAALNVDANRQNSTRDRKVRGPSVTMQEAQSYVGDVEGPVWACPKLYNTACTTGAGTDPSMARPAVDTMSNDPGNNTHYDYGNFSVVTFPKRLLTIIENEGPDVIEWTVHGQSFYVKDAIKDVLPKYFRQTKLQSFQRQLNLYGFTRITKGPDAGSYFHTNFRRDRPDLINTIKRLPGHGARATAKSVQMYASTNSNVSFGHSSAAKASHSPKRYRNGSPRSSQGKEGNGCNYQKPRPEKKNAFFGSGSSVSPPQPRSSRPPLSMTTDSSVNNSSSNHQQAYEQRVAPNDNMVFLERRDMNSGNNSGNDVPSNDILNGAHDLIKGMRSYGYPVRLDTGERHENADPADMDIGQDNQNDMYNRSMNHYQQIMEERMIVLGETMRVLHARSYASVRLPECSAHLSRAVIGPVNVSPVDRFPCTKVMVLDLDLVEASIDLIKRGDNVAILNTSIYEDDLCRRSDLSEHLQAWNSVDRDMIEGVALYSPGVVFFRGNENIGYPFLAKPISLDVITVPACPPHLGLPSSQQQRYHDMGMSREQFLVMIKQRIRTIITLAVGARSDVEHRNTVLLLRPWGCGPNGLLHPKEMAFCFKEVLHEYPGLFKVVAFIIEQTSEHEEAIAKCFRECLDGIELR